MGHVQCCGIPTSTQKLRRHPAVPSAKHTTPKQGDQAGVVSGKEIVETISKYEQGAYQALHVPFLHRVPTWLQQDPNPRSKPHL